MGYCAVREPLQPGARRLRVRDERRGKPRAGPSHPNPSRVYGPPSSCRVPPELLIATELRGARNVFTDPTRLPPVRRLEASRTTRRDAPVPTGRYSPLNGGGGMPSPSWRPRVNGGRRDSLEIDQLMSRGHRRSAFRSRGRPDRSPVASKFGADAEHPCTVRLRTVEGFPGVKSGP
jgi:hypothetical protein